jgi:hypothetical protein
MLAGYNAEVMPMDSREDVRSVGAVGGRMRMAKRMLAADRPGGMEDIVVRSSTRSADIVIDQKVVAPHDSETGVRGCASACVHDLPEAGWGRFNVSRALVPSPPRFLLLTGFRRPGLAAAEPRNNIWKWRWR